MTHWILSLLAERHDEERISDVCSGACEAMAWIKTAGPEVIERFYS